MLSVLMSVNIGISKRFAGRTLQKKKGIVTMKKRLTTSVLAFAVAAITLTGSLTGCGSSQKKTEEPANATEEAAEKTDPDAAGEEQSSGEDTQPSDHTFRVGFVNIDDGDTNCYPAMMNFKAYVESEEFAKAVGADKVEALTADSALDIEKQTTNVETILTKGVDMMFIIGVDTEGNTTSVETCNKEGIPVFMVGTEASGGEWKFVGFDETELGRYQGEWCVENLPENSNICYVEGTPGREAAVMRKQGFMDAIAERDDLNLLSSQTGEFSTEDSMRVTEDWILKYGDDIDCIVAPDNFSILGVCEALKAAGMTDVITCGVVGNRDDAEQIKQGNESYGVFVYWPMIGNLCGEIAQKVYLGEEVQERTNIELFHMTSENCDELLDEYVPK